MAGEAAQRQVDPESHESTVRALLELQNDYLERIRIANGNGNPEQVQALLGELAQKTLGVTSGRDTPHLALVVKAEEPPVKQIYDNSVCTTDLALTVYDGDRDTYLQLLGDEHFMRVTGQIMEGTQPYNARKDLLKTALKLTPKLAPKIFEIVERCKQSIGLKTELELYVCSDVEFNAFCYPPIGGKYIIGVTSALLEKFDANELAFVIGHEIGHALFQHHRFPVNYLLHHGEGHLSPLHAMRLYSWKRNAELSADRVGLICSRDFDAAARAFFKLSSGVTDQSLSFQLHEYIAQFTDLENEVAGQEVDPEDWYSTHPFSPMRLKALDMFNRSESYHKLTGAAPGNAELSEEQLEFDIKKIMSMMEPSYLQDSSELSEHMKSFVFLGGYLVAAANGTVEESEIKALGSLLDPKEVEARVETMKNANPEEVWAQINELCEKLNVMLPVVSKLNVIKDLTIIAGADGSIDQTELDCLYQLTSSLHIRPEFVDHVLNSATEEDDG